jgi:hypothetical protein
MNQLDFQNQMKYQYQEAFVFRVNEAEEKERREEIKKEAKEKL